MDLLNFHSTFKILFGVYEKHYSFGPSANVKPHAKWSSLCNVPATYLLSLYVCVYNNKYDTMQANFFQLARGYILSTWFSL